MSTVDTTTGALTDRRDRLWLRDADQRCWRNDNPSGTMLRDLPELVVQFGPVAAVRKTEDGEWV